VRGVYSVLTLSPPPSLVVTVGKAAVRKRRARTPIDSAQPDTNAKLPRISSGPSKTGGSEGEGAGARVGWNGGGGGVGEGAGARVGWGEGAGSEPTRCLFHLTLTSRSHILFISRLNPSATSLPPTTNWTDPRPGELEKRRLAIPDTDQTETYPPPPQRKGGARDTHRPRHSPVTERRTNEMG